MGDTSDNERIREDALAQREDKLPQFQRGFPKVRPANGPQFRSRSVSGVAYVPPMELPRVVDVPDETVPPVDPSAIDRFRAVPADAEPKASVPDIDIHAAFAQTNLTGAIDDAPTLTPGLGVALARQRAQARGSESGRTQSAYAQTNITAADPAEVRRRAAERAEARQTEIAKEGVSFGPSGTPDDRLADTSVALDTPDSPRSDGPNSTERWLSGLSDDADLHIPDSFFEDVESRAVPPTKVISPVPPPHRTTRRAGQPPPSARARDNAPGRLQETPNTTAATAATARVQHTDNVPPPVARPHHTPHLPHTPAHDMQVARTREPARRSSAAPIIAHQDTADATPILREDHAEPSESLLERALEVPPLAWVGGVSFVVFVVWLFTL